MKSKVTINIATNFSIEPMGRYLTDGDGSGEAFRERVLVPALKEAETVEVILDGTEGYGSSFLDEAFAGLLREHGFSADDFKRRVLLVSKEDPSFIEEILGYVGDEDRRTAARRNKS